MSVFIIAKNKTYNKNQTARTVKFIEFGGRNETLYKEPCGGVAINFPYNRKHTADPCSNAALVLFKELQFRSKRCYLHLA